MRASVLNAMLFLVVAQPFPQISQENPSVSEDSNSLNLDEMGIDKADQDMTTDINQQLVGMSDLYRQPLAVDQADHTSSEYISLSENLGPDGPLAKQNLPGPGSATAAGSLLPSGIPTNPKDQREQQTWIIEPGNGRDPETHPEINRSNSNRLYPPPKCLTLTALCCDGFWVGEWKLGCSTCKSSVRIASGSMLIDFLQMS